MGGPFKDILDMIRLGRFHFLAGGILLYTAGTLVAFLFGYDPDPIRSFLGYGILFGAHLSVSYSNDHFDMEADGFNESSPFSGGSGVLVRRPEMARASLATAVFLILLSFLFAFGYMLLYGLDPILIGIVIAGNALGWSYTSPPLRLAYRGMGEIATSVAVGLLVSAFGFYIAAGGIQMRYFFYGAPMLFYGITFIIDVQIPDMEADRKGKKRTFVTSVGRRISFRAIALLSAVATISLIVVWIAVGEELPFSMLMFAMLSLIPLGASLPPLFSGDMSRKIASGHSSRIMGANFLFLALMDLYLLLEYIL